MTDTSLSSNQDIEEPCAANLRTAFEATRDMLTDARLELDALRAALGVDYEPHQSLHERMLDAANHQRVERGVQGPCPNCGAKWASVELSSSHEPAPALTDRVPHDVAVRLLRVRDLMAKGEHDEAYHVLYGIADPTYTNFQPWAELERTAQPPPDVDARFAALAFALHELQAGIVMHATDTIWYSGIQTAYDRIDEIIETLPTATKPDCSGDAIAGTDVATAESVLAELDRLEFAPPADPGPATDDQGRPMTYWGGKAHETSAVCPHTTIVHHGEGLGSSCFDCKVKL